MSFSGRYLSLLLALPDETKIIKMAPFGAAPKPQDQPNNPLHGVTLQAILEQLVEKHGWEGLAERIHIRCFTFDPSIKSSLKFLRRTEWARREVEALYLAGLP